MAKLSKSGSKLGFSAIAGAILFFMMMPIALADLLPHIVQDTFRELFDGLPQSYNQRAILGLLFFALFYYALSFVIKSKDTGYSKATTFKGAKIIMAVVLAMITAIGMPRSMLDLIYMSWGWIGGILLVILPIVLFMVIAHKVFGNPDLFDQQSGFPNGLRAIWYLLGIAFISQAMYMLPWDGSYYGMSLRDVGELAIFGFFVMAVIYGIKAFRGRPGPDDGADRRDGGRDDGRREDRHDRDDHRRREREDHDDDRDDGPDHGPIRARIADLLRRVEHFDRDVHDFGRIARNLISAGLFPGSPEELNAFNDLNTIITPLQQEAHRIDQELVNLAGTAGFTDVTDRESLNRLTQILTLRQRSYTEFIHVFAEVLRRFGP